MLDVLTLCAGIAGATSSTAQPPPPPSAPPTSFQALHEQLMVLHYPSYDAVRFSDDDNERGTALLSAEQLALVLGDKDAVVADALARLEADGDPIAALLLGELLEARAVPHLLRWYVDNPWGYGWETSRPCELDDGFHPAHVAYDNALVRLTGKHAAEQLVLSHAQTAALLARDDGAARYVLSRLAPRALLRKVVAELRKKRPVEEGDDSFERLELAMELEHLLPGVSLHRAERMLGRTHRARGEVYYRLGSDMFGRPTRLVLHVEDGMIRAASVD